VELRDGIWVDPRHQSLFRVAIEERNRLRRVQGPGAELRERVASFLKTLANACAYGIFAQMDVGEPTPGTEVSVAGVWGFSTRVMSVETPGPYCYPPLAASITGAGRLLLALLISEVERRGGTHLGADTDSLLIVASATGGLVPCRGSGRGPGVVRWAGARDRGSLRGTKPV
jgi:DNA polymerase elongation subunit (family B)